MNSLHLPWIVIGDFNAVCSEEEVKGGSFSYYKPKAHEFSNFITANNFLDVRYIGSNFTWCNNQLGLARLTARLDRCLVNTIWSANVTTYFVKHLPRIFLTTLPFFS